jgi:hypothetical protein
MNPIFEAALEIERICKDAGFRFCFIGGLAVQRWGQPRMTADVDLTIVTGFGGEEPVVDELLVRLQPRIADARAFALQYRTLLVTTSNRVNADISLGAMPFEERAAQRATSFEVAPGASVTTCSAEDLIVHKAFAGREKDWLDIEGIAVRQGGKLQLPQIWDELLPLLELKDDRTTESRLRALLSRPAE